jgi:hypothetical protein
MAFPLLAKFGPALLKFGKFAIIFGIIYFILIAIPYLVIIKPILEILEYDIAPFRTKYFGYGFFPAFLLAGIGMLKP